MKLNRKENQYIREKLILDSAEIMLEKGGFYSISMPELAKISQCSTNTCYSYFKCREDVLVGIFNRYCAKWFVMVGRLISQSPGGFAERFVAKMLLAPYLLSKNIEASGIQFIMDLPIIWDKASPERVIVTRRLLELTATENFLFTRSAKDFSLIEADDETIHSVLTQCFILERGYCTLANNKVYRKLMLEEPFSNFFTNLLLCMKKLNWKIDVMQIDIIDVIKIIENVISQVELLDADCVINEIWESEEPFL